MNNISLNGYHITDTALCENIICNGFTYKHNPKHFLGQGIYFFEQLDIAKYNLNNNKIGYGETNIKSIISCLISVPKEQFLNLDNVLENTKFRKFWNRVIEYLEENKIQLEFQSEKDFNKDNHLYYKCYMLDLYKKHNNFNVIVKTFSIDSPSYGEKVVNVKFSGVPYIEKHICVSGNEFIKNKKVIYSTIEEEVVYI